MVGVTCRYEKRIWNFMNTVIPFNAQSLIVLKERLHLGMLLNPTCTLYLQCLKCTSVYMIAHTSLQRPQPVH